MNITRHNYEEYFILYLDNELSSEVRQQVEHFVAENPDLKAELDLLLQSQLVADKSVVFNEKELLMKTDSSSSINTNNYEEWLLAYTDNELSAGERKAVEQFIGANPSIKAELELLGKAKLQPETIAFPSKDSLYRSEEKVRIVPINWRRIAVAAALILAVSTTALVLFNDNDKDEQTGIASGKTDIKKSVKDNSPVKQPDSQTASPDPKIIDKAAGITVTERKAIENPVAKEEKPGKQKEQTNSATPTEVNQHEPVMADNKEQKKTNDLPQPVHNPNVNRVIEKDNPIAMIDAPEKESLTISKETKDLSIVTPRNPQPLDDVIAVANEEPARKNKFRGFFRKVTRTFEKNTNIKATDDEDRLLLGGLAIKL